ncbi:bifunctional (p)ppGpp synthetase/guanosine-3',5'-bis(diphosphate) 3'-pyrophosphohydrolase [Candidatus Woesearchaeota archaeon]|nr:bifunctional (p)ppGpp synthetase/guanosine-3',5'-bis(diphosphate) 3'-pyrophosphohydrolase [Candidatus Woesearchaeota archaeon]
MSKAYFAEHMGKDDFLKLAVKFNPNANVNLIGKAFDFAEQSHRGQKRLSGRDYFLHCKEVAYMLVKLRLDTATICAGLLHDVLEDSDRKGEEIRRTFGEEIHYLVVALTKTKNISLQASDEERAENIRKVLLASIKDIRVIFIKLADRLHNMRTLKYQPYDKQVAVSRETLDIYVPIAYKLGMYRIKSELEDLCLKHLNPSVYMELKVRIDKKKEEREQEVKSVIKTVKNILSSRGIKAKISGRAKNFFSIYKKMLRKGVSFEEIHDLSAIRIIADNPDDCYRILGIIHSTWTPLVKRFDDYIAFPKPNMYQSLHTEVLINKKPVEVQIRTWKMHHIAEEGFAAHWRYKDTERDKRFDRKIAWLKQILEWRMSSNAKEFLENLKIDLFKDEIYAITPKGDPISLPEKATPVDFAFAVHTDIGNRCVRAKVNNAIVPLDHELKSGDVVEIITSKNAVPSRNWLKFVKTTLAKSKIRHGLGILLPEAQSEKEIADEEQVISRIDFEKSSMLKLSRCCLPRYGDQLTGYRMKDGKIAVHKAGCDNFRQLDSGRKMLLGWKGMESSGTVKLRAEVIESSGMFQEVLGSLTSSGVKIESIRAKTSKNRLLILLEVKPGSELGKAIDTLKKVENVIEVRIE